MPQWFKVHGYTVRTRVTLRQLQRCSRPLTASLAHFSLTFVCPVGQVLGGGKSYHPGLPPNYDQPLSWTQEMPYFP